VTNGDGLAEIFKSVGVDIIIKGGQTMNPSTYDIVKAIKALIMMILSYFQITKI
jgi:uncharacterized protein